MIRKVVSLVLFALVVLVLVIVLSPILLPYLAFVYYHAWKVDRNYMHQLNRSSEQLTDPELISSSRSP